MAAELGQLGNGTKIAYSNTSPVTWVNIPYIRSIDKWFELIPPKVDTFVSGDAIKTTIPGIPESPEIEFTIRYDANASNTVAHESLRSLQTAGTIVWWRTERPVNTPATLYRPEEFRGYVLSFSPTAPLDNIQEAKVVISYSGSYAIYPVEATEIT
jgi:hypothetical protein